MNRPIRPEATYADIEALPPNLVGELILGSLVTHPRPVPRHAIAAMSLGDELTSPFQKGRGGPGGWTFMIEPELHLGDNILVPDLAAWRRETLPAEPAGAWMSVRPDWLCEILSPATQKYDRGAKRDIYARAGVQHLWLLDPAAKLLEAFSLSADGWRLQATLQNNDSVSLAPFDAISFSLGLLWPYDTEADETSEP